MVTQTLVPVEEYLSSVYRPDVDYVDGVIQERNVGEFEHNMAQLYLVNWFNEHGREWQVRAIQEQRTRLTPTRYRIPDVGVFARSQSPEAVFTRPYLIAIEVLSPEDKHGRIQERIEDFIKFEVPNIWVVDPVRPVGWDCSDGNWVRRDTLEAKGSAIYLALDTLFARIDEDLKD